MTSMQIQCFLTSAQTLNFTKTAQLLYISQPVVTHHILNLEEELGFQLFERNKKQIFLTFAGEKFYTSIQKISSEFHEAVLYAKQCESEYDNHICIGCGSSEFEKDFLPVIIRSFREKYPKTYVTYDSSILKQKFKLFQQHKIDILFSTTHIIKDFREIEYYDLLEHPVICLMNKENPLSHQDEITIQDLHDQNLIFLDSTVSPPEIEKLQQQISLKYPQRITHYIEAPSIAHLMILSNMGIAVMPEFKYQKNENLVAVPYADYDAISYGIAKHKNDNREAVNSFIEITKTTIRHMYPK